MVRPDVIDNDHCIHINIYWFIFINLTHIILISMISMINSNDCDDDTRILKGVRASGSVRNSFVLKRDYE